MFRENRELAMAGWFSACETRVRAHAGALVSALNSLFSFKMMSQTLDFEEQSPILSIELGS